MYTDVERPVYRHPVYRGSVVEFYDTELRRVLVLDSVYRDVHRWGACDMTVSRLMEYQISNMRDTWYLNGNRYSSDNAVTCMPDAEINQLWVDSIDSKTAKENCDIWMSQPKFADLFGIVGVPAVEYTRSILINGTGCDIPNIQTLMRIYLEADRIDALDPTVKHNPIRALGRMNQSGYWDCMGACSSSNYNNYDIRAIGSTGDCGSAGREDVHFVIPIREL